MANIVVGSMADIVADIMADIVAADIVADIVADILLLPMSVTDIYPLPVPFQRRLFVFRASQSCS